MKLRPPHLVAVAILVLLAAIGLAACGEKSEDESAGSEPFSLTLDFYPNPDHAGIYMTQKLGYFKDAGLDLTIHTPSDPAAPIKQVAAGRTDLAISYEPEVILAREKGLDVVTVGVIVDSALTSLIWVHGNLSGVADLRGKTVATAGIPYQDAYLKTILAWGGLTPKEASEVKTINVGYGLLPAVISGRADAILGGFRNIEGRELRVRGESPVVDTVTGVGVPEYDELVLVAQRDRLEEDPEAIRLFLAALIRGTADAINRQEETTEAVLAANPDLDPRLTRGQVRETLSLLSRRGRIDEDEWRKFIAWMAENDLIAAPIPTSEVLTNEYLPGEIP
jgi:putative hydroxymethylpyrimidine transport system substrate-binding protein